MGAVLEAAAFHFAEQLRHLTVDGEHGPGGVRCPCGTPRGPLSSWSEPQIHVFNDCAHLQGPHPGLERVWRCVLAIAPSTSRVKSSFGVVWGLSCPHQLYREGITKKRMAWPHPCFSSVAVGLWYVRCGLVPAQSDPVEEASVLRVGIGLVLQEVDLGGLIGTYDTRGFGPWQLPGSTAARPLDPYGPACCCRGT